MCENENASSKWFFTHCVNNIHGQDSCDDEKWFDSLIDTTQKSSGWASKTLSCNLEKTFMMLPLNFCNPKFSQKIIKLSVCQIQHYLVLNLEVSYELKCDFKKTLGLLTSYYIVPCGKYVPIN